MYYVVYNNVILYYYRVTVRSVFDCVFIIYNIYIYICIDIFIIMIPFYYLSLYLVIFSQVIKSKTVASRFEYQFILIHLPNDLLSQCMVMKLYNNIIFKKRTRFTFYEFSSR